MDVDHFFGNLFGYVCLKIFGTLFSSGWSVGHVIFSLRWSWYIMGYIGIWYIMVYPFSDTHRHTNIRCAFLRIRRLTQQVGVVRKLHLGWFMIVGWFPPNNYHKLIISTNGQMAKTWIFLTTLEHLLIFLATCQAQVHLLWLRHGFCRAWRFNPQS